MNQLENDMLLCMSCKISTKAVSDTIPVRKGRTQSLCGHSILPWVLFVILAFSLGMHILLDLYGPLLLNKLDLFARLRCANYYAHLDDFAWHFCALSTPFNRTLGAISICDLVLNIAYFPEISRFFERLSAQVPFQEVLRVAFVPCTYSLFMYPNSHETVNELY